MISVETSSRVTVFVYETPVKVEDEESFRPHVYFIEPFATVQYGPYGNLQLPVLLATVTRTRNCNPNPADCISRVSIDRSNEDPS